MLLFSCWFFLKVFLCSVCLPTQVIDFYLVLHYHILKYAVKPLNACFLQKPFRFSSNTDRILKEGYITSKTVGKLVIPYYHLTAKVTRHTLNLHACWFLSIQPCASTPQQLVHPATPKQKHRERPSPSGNTLSRAYCFSCCENGKPFQGSASKVSSLADHIALFPSQNPQRTRC